MADLRLKGRKVPSPLSTGIVTPISVLETGQRFRLLKFLKDFRGPLPIKWKRKILPSLYFHSDDHLEFELSHFYSFFKGAEGSLISIGQGYSRPTCCAASSVFTRDNIFRRPSVMEGLA